MKEPKENDVVLLTREEAKVFLKTTFPTLLKWTVEGLIKRYQLGNRIYYKKHEIIRSLKQIN